MPQTAKAKKRQPTLTNQKPKAGTASQNERSPDGKFAAGNSGGPGNPHARHCARMLALFRNCISDEEMVAIIRKLSEKAAAGDTSAAKLILSYKIGKPSEAPNPDQIDQDEWDHYQKDAINLNQVQLVLSSLPTNVGNGIVRSALPIMTDARTKQLAAELREGCPVPPEAAEGIGDTGKETVEEAPIANGKKHSHFRDDTKANQADEPVTRGKKMGGKNIRKKNKPLWLRSMAKRLKG
jgi:hypothetical protein